ncbi:hypothetical protein DL93DRAFT_1787720 [Clavulina sp. PMI_390]|nr:hypothetical protein DL93DRAFT_1787720 [Clavulina sp. PMI_390]
MPKYHVDKIPNRDHSGLLPSLPLEIYHAIALQLDVVSIIRLSMTCKSLSNYIQTSLGLWRRISDREAQKAALAPFSVLATLSVKDMMVFATRPYRMMSLSSLALNSGATPVGTLITAKEPSLLLRNDELLDRQSAEHGSHYLLPGGRWMVGVQSKSRGYPRLMCWDVASAVSDVPCDPVASVSSQHRALGFPEEFSLSTQFDPERQSVTCLLAYIGQLEGSISLPRPHTRMRSLLQSQLAS